MKWTINKQFFRDYHFWLGVTSLSLFWLNSSTRSLLGLTLSALLFTVGLNALSIALLRPDHSGR
ncbi:hypothetical protein KB236_02760 [Levilactobacillus brevis]|nr:hypothetical protein KB236_02760 [Levilactobacillus brevis]